MSKSKPLVAVIMGSKSDWETMRHCIDTLDELGIANEHRILSAHRTPNATADFARKAEDRGLRIIIAGAGSAAHLAGVVAGLTQLPVLGVPIPSSTLHGLDSLLSIAQMPGGIPVGGPSPPSLQNAQSNSWRRASQSHCRPKPFTAWLSMRLIQSPLRRFLKRKNGRISTLSLFTCPIAICSSWMPSISILSLRNEFLFWDSGRQ